MYFFLVLLHHYTAKCAKEEKVEIEALEKEYNFNFSNNASTAPTATPATPKTLRYYPHSTYLYSIKKKKKTKRKSAERKIRIKKLARPLDLLNYLSDSKQTKLLKSCFTFDPRPVIPKSNMFVIFISPVSICVCVYKEGWKKKKLSFRLNFIILWETKTSKLRWLPTDFCYLQILFDLKEL